MPQCTDAKKKKKQKKNVKEEEEEEEEEENRNARQEEDDEDWLWLLHSCASCKGPLHLPPISTTDTPSCSSSSKSNDNSLPLNDEGQSPSLSIKKEEEDNDNKKSTTATSLPETEAAAGTTTTKRKLERRRITKNTHQHPPSTKKRKEHNNETIATIKCQNNTCVEPYYHLSCSSIPVGSRLYRDAIVTSYAKSESFAFQNDKMKRDHYRKKQEEEERVRKYKNEGELAAFDRQTFAPSPPPLFAKPPPPPPPIHKNMLYTCPKCDVEGTSRYLLEYFESYRASKIKYYQNDDECVDRKTGVGFVEYLLKSVDHVESSYDLIVEDDDNDDNNINKQGEKEGKSNDDNKRKRKRRIWKKRKVGYKQSEVRADCIQHILDCIVPKQNSSLDIPKSQSSSSSSSSPLQIKKEEGNEAEKQPQAQCNNPSKDSKQPKKDDTKEKQQPIAKSHETKTHSTPPSNNNNNNKMQTKNETNTTATTTTTTTTCNTKETTIDTDTSLNTKPKSSTGTITIPNKKNVIQPSFFVGKPVRLYNKITDSYHLGRIVDWKENAVSSLDGDDENTLPSNVSSSTDSTTSSRFNPDRILQQEQPKKKMQKKREASIASPSIPSVSSSSTDFKQHNNAKQSSPSPPISVDPAFGRTQYLIRFRYGIDGRKVSVHQWVYLEEHPLTIGIASVWVNIGRSSDDSSTTMVKEPTTNGSASSCKENKKDTETAKPLNLSSLRPAQIVVRTALEMAPVKEINPSVFSISDGISGAMHALAFFFGKDFHHAVLRLETPMITSPMSSSSHSSSNCNSNDNKKNEDVDRDIVAFDFHHIPKSSEQLLRRAQYDDKSLALGIAMACMELEEERRARTWHGLTVRVADILNGSGKEEGKLASSDTVPSKDKTGVSPLSFRKRAVLSS